MLNKIILMGRLTADPEQSQTKTGVPVLRIRIAVQRTYNRDQTDWIDVVAWRHNAEFISKHFKKGSLIIVEGSIQSRNYEDKDGNKRTAIEVVASQLHFGGFSKNKETEDDNINQSPSFSDMEDYEEIDGEGLPF